jgi:hypothetical protein
MAYENAIAARGERPSGEATSIARNNLSRLDNATTRLDALLEAARGPEPRPATIGGERSNDAALVPTLQRTDNALDRLFEIIDRLEAAV